MNTCQYCKSIFTKKSSLNRHQQTVKYCLDIQEKCKNKEKYKCNFCNKELSCKRILDKHHNICKKNPEIKKLEKNIEKKIEYTNITINNNNTINSITNNYNSITSHITPELIKFLEILKFLIFYNLLKKILQILFILVVYLEKIQHFIFVKIDLVINLFIQIKIMKKKKIQKLFFYEN